MGRRPARSRFINFLDDNAGKLVLGGVVLTLWLAWNYPIGRWAFGSVFLLVSLVVCSLNPVAAYRARHTDRSFSMVPVVGGLVGAAGMLVLPVGTLQSRARLAWIPIILDVTIPLFVFAFLAKIPWEAWKQFRRRE